MAPRKFSLFIICILGISAAPGSLAAAFSLSCSDSFEGQYQQRSVLKCVIESNVEGLVVKAVTWIYNENGRQKVLLSFKDSKTMVEPGFSFSQPSWNDRNLDVSLLIESTVVENQGAYTCIVATNAGNGKEVVDFKVHANYSQPTVRYEQTKVPNAESELVCESSGGYPEGTLRWFDESDKDWDRSSPETKPILREDGRFDLRRALPLFSGSTFSKYTCKVFNSNKMKEGEITVERNEDGTFGSMQDPLAPSQSKGDKEKWVSKVVAPAVVIGSLIVGLLMALFIYKRRSQRSERPNENVMQEGKLLP